MLRPLQQLRLLLPPLPQQLLLQNRLRLKRLLLHRLKKPLRLLSVVQNLLLPQPLQNRPLPQQLPLQKNPLWLSLRRPCVVRMLRTIPLLLPKRLKSSAMQEVRFFMKPFIPVKMVFLFVPFMWLNAKEKIRCPSKNSAVFIR